MGLSTTAAAHADDSVYPASRALQEVLRLEEALAAASKGISDRIAARASAAAVEVDQDPLSAGTNERVADATHPPRDVARLEDVLTVGPNGDSDANVAGSVAPALPAPNQIQLDEHAPTAPVESPTRVDQHSAEPTYVAARALREAFWFEQASAFKPGSDDRATTGQAPEAALAAVPSAADSMESAPRSPSAGDAEPCAEHANSPSPLELWMGRARSNWPAAVWVLALVALVLLLAGRNRRRST